MSQENFRIYIFAIATFVFSQQVVADEISRGVGRSGDWMVTSREVVINHMLEQALYVTGGKSLPALDLNQVRSREFIRETTSVLLETAIFAEAESFSQTSSKDLNAQAESLISTAHVRLQNNKKWKELAPTEKELSKFIKRKVRAKDFLKFKMSSASIPISDREAEDYFRNNRMKFENLPFSAFKENIKGYLTKQEMDRRLKDWFELLQSKYRVRNFLTD